MNREYMLIYILSLVISTAIVFVTFWRVREKSLAVRGLLALGFLGLFFGATRLFFRIDPTAVLAVTTLPFAVVAAIETWGKRE